MISDGVSHDYAAPLFEREKIVTLNLMEIESLFETWRRSSWRVSGHQVGAVKNGSGACRRMLCFE